MRPHRLLRLAALTQGAALVGLGALGCKNEPVHVNAPAEPSQEPPHINATATATPTPPDSAPTQASATAPAASSAAPKSSATPKTPGSSKATTPIHVNSPPPGNING